MRMKTLTIHHLVKGEDLNHHRTLFAGRGRNGWWKPALSPRQTCCHHKTYSA